MNRNTKRAFIPAMVLSTAMFSSLIMGSVTAHAATTNPPMSSAVSSSQSVQSNYTKPTAPVQFQVPMTKQNLDSMHLKYSNGTLSSTDQGNPPVGILLTGGSSPYLATQDNGELSFSTDGSTITVTATHPTLDRYTSYSANLLVGDIMHKYQTQLNSGGHAQSFAHVSQDAMQSVSFQTGSAIGEATHVTATLANSSVKVTSSGHLTIKATDDYGDPATNATLTLTGSGKGNALVPSDFSTTKTTQIKNGTVTVPLSDHSAEAITLAYTVQDNTYNDAVDTQSGTLIENFLPGNTAKLQVTNPSKIVAGSTASFSGMAEDTYGNAVSNGTQISETAQSGTISNATATQSGDFSFSLNSTKSGSDTLTVKAGDSGYSTTDSVTVSPATPSKVTITLPSTLTQGSTASVSGTVSDQYGNPEPNTSVTFSGSLSGTLTTNTSGQYSGSLKVGSSGSVSASTGSTSLSLTNSSGSSITSLTTKPAVPTMPILYQSLSGLSYVSVNNNYQGSWQTQANGNDTGWHISGRLYSGSYMTPMSNRTFYVWTNQSNQVYQVNTDANGNFNTTLPITMKQGTQFYYHFGEPNFSGAPMNSAFYGGSWGTNATAPGTGPSRITINATTYYTYYDNERVSGYAYNANGQPMANVPITLWSNDGFFSPSTVYTNSQGYYSTNFTDYYSGWITLKASSGSVSASTMVDAEQPNYSWWW